MADPPIVAWTVNDWARLTSLSKSYVYKLVSRGVLTSVKSGKRRLITTAPQSYIDALAA